MYLDLKTHVFF